MVDHTVKSYNAEFALLNKKLAMMGGLTENILGMAFDALDRRDPDGAQQAIKADLAIDAMQLEINDLVVEMIARRQPVATDLRQILAALQVTGELERIGDLCKNIAKRSLAIAGEPYPRPLVSGLSTMVNKAQEQLKAVLDSYAERNVDMALKVWRDDAQLDAMYNTVFRELLTYMMEDPRNISLCTQLLFGAKNVERIGDHATNIAETVHFIVRGHSIQDVRPKGDTTASLMLRN